MMTSNSSPLVSTDPMASETIFTVQNSPYPFLIHYLSIYSLVLILFGTVGNFLTIIVLLRRRLRRFVTVRYLIMVSICDTIALYGWNLNSFYKFNISTHNSNIEDLSLLHCRLISFLSFVALQLSSWCLSAVSLDRALSLYWMLWKQSYGRVKYTKYYILVLTSICIVLNSHILFLNGYRTPSGIITCYSTRSNPGYIYPQWERVHLVLYNLCPFTIMCICNTYIIYNTVRSSRAQSESTPGKGRRKSLDKYREFTTLLIIVTFAFVLLTLPACIYFVFFRNDLASRNERSYRYMIQILLNSIQFTSHGINFFLYCFSASSFRYELRAMFRGLALNSHWISGHTRQNDGKRRYVNRNYPRRISQRHQRDSNREIPMHHYKFNALPELQSLTDRRTNGL